MKKPDIRILLENLSVCVNKLVHVTPYTEWIVSEHFHEYFEFHFIPCGKGRIFIEGTEFSVNKGEFYITGPFIRHTQQADKKNPMAEYTLGCDIRLIDDSEEENRLLVKALSNCMPYAFKDVYDICRHFEDIIGELNSKNLGYQIKIQSLIIQIIIDMFRTISSDEKELPYKKLTQMVLDKQRIERILSIISKEYGNKLSVKNVSEQLFISDRHINRLMNRHIGQSFHEYLSEYRFKKACNLLKDSKYSVDEIAYMVGYSSARYMYEVFAAKAGKTPAALRNGV